MVEQWNSKVAQCGGTVEKWNSHGGTVWRNSRTVMVEQCGGTVEH